MISMTGGTRHGSQSTATEDAIRFAQKNGLVTETSGTMTLTENGKRFLDEYLRVVQN